MTHDSWYQNSIRLQINLKRFSFMFKFLNIILNLFVFFTSIRLKKCKKFDDSLITLQINLK